MLQFLLTQIGKLKASVSDLNGKAIKTGDSTIKADNAGRVYLAIAPHKLLSVAARDTTHWCVCRYISSGSDVGTLVYVYNMGTFTPVAEDTEITLDYSYIE